MPRTLLLILGILMGTPMFGKRIPDQFNKAHSFEWPVVESKSMSEGQLKNLTLNQPQLLDYFPFDNFESAKEHRSSFHFVDHDQDGDSDLWYNGYTGAESDGLYIFQNQHNTFQLICHLFGSIREINQYQGKITSFNLLNYACCAGYVDHLQTFHFNDLYDSVFIVSAIAKIIYTPTENTQMESVLFEVTQKEYNLRIDPAVIQYEEKPFEFEPINDQNIAAVYYKGDKGTAIAKRIDAIGREWWLVIMDPKYQNKDPGLFYEGDNTFDHYAPMGWMSSRYLKVLK